MVTKSPKKQPLTRELICDYVWARYIDNRSPKVEVDEEEALKFFEDYYSKHPLNTDDECFFYGILLYERSFSDEANRDRYVVKAKEVFEVYRNVSGETEWDVIEDRYADVCDMIEKENLLDTVKTATDLAPEVEGMVLVPAGPFPFGEEGRETLLEPFYIDVFPVTVGQYKQFCEAEKYRRPRLWELRPDLAEEDLPVTGVSWMDALQYCKWKRHSLPTAQQWEKAARGAEGLVYPWGDEEPTPERANVFDEGGRQPKLQPVTRYAQSSRSPFGVCCMIGGVWEWTNTPYPEVENAQVIKGGSYVDPIDRRFLASYGWMWADKKEKNELIGFRTTKRLEGL